MALDLAHHLFTALPNCDSTRPPSTSAPRSATRSSSTRRRAVIVWEPRRIVPSYAVPVADIAGSLTPARPRSADARAVTIGDGPPVLDPRTGFAFHTTAGQAFDIAVGSTTLPRRGVRAIRSRPRRLAILDFDAFDEWREEDEVLVGHARDPFKTVDTRRSSRRVVVAIGDVVVADSSRPIMLFETHLPTRYYLPRDDVRMDLLTPSDTTTVCAYKGRATYWSATFGADRARRRLQLPGAAQLRHRGRGPHLLLQRARRHHRRRHAAAATADALA